MQARSRTHDAIHVFNILTASTLTLQLTLDLCADPNMGLASTQAQHRHRFLQRPCSGLLQSVALCVRSMQPVRACSTWACSVQQLKLASL